MLSRPLTVVISQGQSRSPEKRALEEAVAQRVAALPHIDVMVVPHLYDLSPQGKSIVRMKQVSGPLIVISWLYDRASHWTLDRVGIRGQFGEVQLKATDDDDDDDDEGHDSENERDDARVSEHFPRPARPIYHLDFRASLNADAFVAEIQRIHAEAVRFVEQQLAAAPLTTGLVVDGTGRLGIVDNEAKNPAAREDGLNLQAIAEHPGRRWYPVIDFSRCTNCMECIDFCLFGVYGVDAAETILVEQPDNCRKGCPACSRVCPANAIMFPQHKTPAIAGAPFDVAGLKIDLSKLFGAPEREEDPLAAAARERDEQLILAGRDAVGPRNRANQSQVILEKSTEKDDLDKLLDELDQLNL